MATAFIGLDYINDIVHPEGKISHIAEPAAERGIIAKVNRALEIARNKEWLTILVKVGFSKGYLDHPKRSPFFGKLHENHPFSRAIARARLAFAMTPLSAACWAVCEILPCG